MKSLYVSYKIKEVPDTLCRQCVHCYEDKCRAFCVSHSEEEQLRRKDKECLCMSSIDKEILD